MKFPILFLTLAGLALSAACLSGCGNHAGDMPAAVTDAASSAACDRAGYMEEFNEIVRSLSGERNDDVQVNRGWGVFNMISVTPNKETMPA
ncbi:protein BimD [Burkholderia pyrrocinia]